jgi:hypothetical protein
MTDRTKGARDETKPITHSLGMQIPYRLGTEEAAQNSCNGPVKIRTKS